jgi:hypothetical protein
MEPDDKAHHGHNQQIRPEAGTECVKAREIQGAWRNHDRTGSGLGPFQGYAARNNTHRGDRLHTPAGSDRRKIEEIGSNLRNGGAQQSPANAFQ